MANYTQQCRVCSRNIEGTGEDICFQCLQRERTLYQQLSEQLEEERDKLQLAIEISAKPIRYFVDLKAERDALQKQLLDTTIERDLLAGRREASAREHERLEAALQQYALPGNWNCIWCRSEKRHAEHLDIVWSWGRAQGKGDGPDLAKAALGLGDGRST